MGCYITSVAQSKVMAGHSANVSVGGYGFISPVSLIVAGQTIPASFANAATLQFTLPSLPAGVYNISVLNGDGSTWIARNALTVTSAASSLSVGVPGSPTMPLVLPPVLGSSFTTPIISQSTKILALNTPALVSTTDLVAVKQVTTGSISNEPVEQENFQNSPGTGKTLVTRWGTFTN